LAEELGGINYDWQLAGPPGGSEYKFSVVPALLTVYLLHELKVPDKRVYDRDKLKVPDSFTKETKRQRSGKVKGVNP
jgi:hypothetical protein